MRIKFRAWDKECKTMVHPKGLLFDGRIVNFSCGMIEPYEGYKLMQWTGLLDINGKEIYEGDLLQHPNGTIAEIQYSNDLAAFVAVYVQNGNTEVDYLDKEIVSKCKIAGNIYENPELLEVEGEKNEICPTCNGSGGFDVLEYSIGEIVTVPCSDCGGSGKTTDVARQALESEE